MKFEIKHRYDNRVLYSGEGETICAVLVEAVKTDADLRGANLYGADLGGAYLGGAYLRDAYLRDACMRGADLRDADLRGAYLCGADLRGANLRGANLCDADLGGANLRDADLCVADLRGADLRDADLRDAKGLTPLWIAQQSILPAGSIIGYKKLRCGSVLALEIPADAARVNAIGSRKCRAEYAIPSAVFDKDGKVVVEPGKLVSTHSADYTYEIGKECRPDKWDPDVHVECSHGIHFFITFEEAVDYA